MSNNANLDPYTAMLIMFPNTTTPALPLIVYCSWEISFKIPGQPQGDGGSAIYGMELVAGHGIVAEWANVHRQLMAGHLVGGLGK